MVNLFAENFADLTQNLASHTQSQKKEFKPDERFWKLSKDDQGNGTAIIRLLPDSDGKAYTKMLNHAFSIYNKDLNKKLWFIEDSPSTIKLPCPVSELWAELGKVGTEEAKAEQKLFSRKLNFITNILVVNDPSNPDNNGKIFLWKFGTKLQDKFIAAMNPSEDDINMGEEPVPLYHALKGANIKLKIKKSSGFFNYDDTTVMKASEAFESREEAEDVLLNKTYKLSEFESPEYFKTYEELSDKLAFVRGLKKTKNTERPVEQKAPDTMDTMDIGETSTEDKPKTKAETKAETKVEPKVETKTEPVDDDDDLDFLDDL